MLEILDEELSVEFLDWAAKYGRHYSDVAEYFFRLHTFFENKAAAHEIENEEEMTSTIVENDFADWTEEELTILTSGLDPDPPLLANGDEEEVL